MDTLERIALSASKATEEDKAKLKKRAKIEFERLDKLFSNSDTKKRIDTFKDMFSQCEIVYKLILKDFKKNTGKKTANREKIQMSEVPYALAYAGYNFDYEFLEKLFGSESRCTKMSVKILRDNLTHSIKESALKELNDRYDELIGYMETFLNTIKNAQ